MIFKSPYPDVALPNIALSKFFLDRIQPFADKTALIDSITGRTYSYALLSRSIKSVGASLSARGLQKGETIAIFSPNLPEYAIAFHGASLIGGVITTISPLCTWQKIFKGNCWIQKQNSYSPRQPYWRLDNKPAPIPLKKYSLSSRVMVRLTPFSDLLKKP